MQIKIYDGSIKANKIGSIVRGGITFEIIRPGYNDQGRQMVGWTQFVFKGVPVFEVKRAAELKDAIKKFDDNWDKHIASNEAILAKALEACVKSRRKLFKDGVTGEAPAPSLEVEGLESGTNYPS
jgi:hypothetical protein